MSMPDPRSLVCDSCWTKLFNTQAFEDFCVRRVERPQDSCSVDYEAPMASRNTQKNCSWCTFTKLCSSGWNIRDLGWTSWTNDQFRVCLKRQPYVGLHEGVQVHNRHGDDPRTVSIKLSTPVSNPAAPYVRARPIQRNVSIKATAGQLQSWMEECRRHAACPADADVELPTRVIQVSGHGAPQLVAPAGRKGKYATLSYCWGPTPHGLLTTLNVDQYMRQLPMNRLPQTVRDAIAVAKAIAIDYLWIDAVCILQDSPDDKANEIANMAKIYHQSAVTIVVASAVDMTSGFLQKRPEASPYSTHDCELLLEPGQQLNIPIRIAPGTFGSATITCHWCDLHHDDGKEPINQRAWTLQEQAVAQRLLIYSSQTLRWRCPSKSRNLDDAPHDYPYENPIADLVKVPTTPEHALVQWENLVKLYSIRKMSVASDRLPAIAAIAQKYSQALGPGYFAGFWQFNVVRQLYWMKRGDTKVKNEESTNSDSRSYCGPSWSWVSSNRAVEYPAALERPLCEVVDISTVLQHGNNAYGEVASGRLVLRGRGENAFMLVDIGVEGLAGVLIWVAGLVTSALSADAYFREHKWYMFSECHLDNINIEKKKEAQLVTCVQLSMNFGLILRAVDGSEGGSRNFERIGIARYHLEALSDRPLANYTII